MLGAGSPPTRADRPGSSALVVSEVEGAGHDAAHGTVPYRRPQAPNLSRRNESRSATIVTQWAPQSLWPQGSSSSVASMPRVHDRTLDHEDENDIRERGRSRDPYSRIDEARWTRALSCAHGDLLRELRSQGGMRYPVGYILTIFRHECDSSAPRRHGTHPAGACGRRGYLAAHDRRV